MSVKFEVRAFKKDEYAHACIKTIQKGWQTTRTSTVAQCGKNMRDSREKSAEGKELCPACVKAFQVIFLAFKNKLVFLTEMCDGCGEEKKRTEVFALCQGCVTKGEPA